MNPTAGGSNLRVEEAHVVSIALLKNKTHQLSVLDYLDHSCPEKSMIEFRLSDVPEGNQEPTIIVIRMRYEGVKLACFDIANRFFEETQFKIPYRNRPGTGAPFSLRMLTISKNSKYRLPFVFKFDDCDAEPEGTGYKTLECRNSLSLLLSEQQARMLALAIHDYIRDWETVNLRRRQESMTIVVPGRVTSQ